MGCVQVIVQGGTSTTAAGLNPAGVTRERQPRPRQQSCGHVSRYAPAAPAGGIHQATLHWRGPGPCPAYCLHGGHCLHSKPGLTSTLLDTVRTSVGMRRSPITADVSTLTPLYRTSMVGCWMPTLCRGGGEPTRACGRVQC